MLLALQKDCTKIKREWHCPWCGDDTRKLGWGVGMHQAVVWAKAADHHGASGIAFSPATRVIFLPKKYRGSMVWYISMKVEDKNNGRCKTPHKLVPYLLVGQILGSL